MIGMTAHKLPETQSVIVTCEHGGNHVPRPYRYLFHEAEAILESHRGWDPGALKLAKKFSSQLNAPLFSATVTRLLVELNRSPGHPQLFSEFTKSLSRTAKEELLKEYWHPYRRSVEAAITHEIEAENRVLHLSIHSFTPVWDGSPRSTNVGLLYDPSRSDEKDVCVRWQTAIRTADSRLTVHRNAPYRGSADGFVTALRRRYSPDRYTGIELEVNQKYFNVNQKCQPILARLLIRSFQQTLAGE